MGVGCGGSYEADAAPAADLGGDVAREEDGAVEDAGGHDGAGKPASPQKVESALRTDAGGKGSEARE